MGRLSITRPTLKKLFALSGNLCAFPECSQPVVNEHGDLIAEVCHIEAAEKGGQRYNSAQSDEDRRAFENLLILCPTHHAVTDNVQEYPAERLRQIKRDHENRFASAQFEIDDALAARLHEQTMRQWRRRLKNIALSKLLRHAAETLVGRDAQLQRIDDAWADSGTHVVSIVAWGGVGKTALTAEWMTWLAAQDWPGVGHYFDWSFYSQGTRDQGTASADLFIAAALEHFGDPDPQAGSAWDRGERLARLIAECSPPQADGSGASLIILDGLEPLQHGPGPVEGQLKDPAVAALLKGLAQRPFGGLCLVTTREPVSDLNAFHDRTVAEWRLEHLSDDAGAELLHRAGANRAGQASIGPADAELLAASREVQGHALTLQLLGRYLALAHHGDIWRRDRVRLDKADANVQGGHAFRVMAAYERWLVRQTFQSDQAASSQAGKPDVLVAILRLLGLFDRPADPGCLEALRKPPVIDDLTQPLVDLDEDDWNIALTQLAELGLISTDSSRSAFRLPHSAFVDAHPLVREYFGRQLRDEAPDAWRAAHRRLYEYLCKATDHRPDTLAALQPLYQAVAHGCQAGLHQQACDDVYFKRILRGTGPGGNYSTFKLGAIGANLGAVACFFDAPWSRLSPNFSPGDQAWLLNESAFFLRALGRLTEAVEPMRAVLERDVNEKSWKEAAVSASNLSELELTLGDVSAAVADGEQSVTFADRSEDEHWPGIARATHADALHQAGRREESLRLFREAEAMQAERQPEYPRLYSLRGFQYCDLLLAGAERSAWRVMMVSSQRRLTAGPAARAPAETPSPLGLGLNDDERAAAADACDEVTERATEGLGIAQQAGLSLLTIGLEHLTLGRAALYWALLGSAEFEIRNAESPSLDSAFRIPQSALDHLTAAVDGLRQAGTMHELPRGLLTRAWLRFLEEDESGSRADLAEAWEIAERGPMPLFQADIQLTTARLFRDPQALAEARRLIEKHGYHRRKEELADAQQAIGTTEDP